MTLLPLRNIDLLHLVACLETAFHGERQQARWICASWLSQPRGCLHLLIQQFVMDHINCLYEISCIRATAQPLFHSFCPKVTLSNILFVLYTTYLAAISILVTVRYGRLLSNHRHSPNCLQGKSKAISTNSIMGMILILPTAIEGGPGQVQTNSKRRDFPGTRRRRPGNCQR